MKAHAAQVALFMPDDFSAEMTVQISSAPGSNEAEKADQRSRIDATVAALSNKFDLICFDESNVHVYPSDSLSVNAATGDVDTNPTGDAFSGAELAEMKRRMEEDPSRVQYFD